KKDKVTLIGFGTFSTSERAERQGKNPQTGKAMTIPAKTVIKFKAGKALGDEVNNG
ncbi:MAG: HU family DNA-binding protein, partial [Desulfobacterales bacterium]|nr:HU family DNA-binding protein [Desulfobacterales bacterium]